MRNGLLLLFIRTAFLGLLLSFFVINNVFGQTYCIPTFSGTATTYYISGFETTGGVTNLSNTGTARGAGGYSDYSATHSFTATAGSTINLTITIEGGSSTTHGSAIWIDWNNDGTFEATEKVFNTTGYTSSPHTGSFTIPVTTPGGTYRMRIVQDYYSSNPGNPCSFNTGEAEDYTIIVEDLYCIPTFSSSTATHYISGITTTGSEIDLDNTGTLRGTDGYSNYASTDLLLALEGTTVNFSLAIDGGGSYGVAIWIDWNDNGTFEASERVYNTTSAVSSPHAGSFNIPLTANRGQHRMRIAIDNSSVDMSDACSFNTGEVEDYTIQVGLPYCTPVFSSTSTTYYISGFTTTGGLTNINNTGTSRGADGYSDYSATHSLTALAGSTIDFTITIAPSGTHGSAIWVDWNRDGTFDASERVHNTTSYASSPHTGSFVIPAGIPAGSYRMRVAQDYSNNNPSDPCNFNNGEVEDYNLIVSEYCTPTFTSTTATHYISGVTTTGSHTNLNNTGTSRGTDGYSNYSSTHSFIAFEGSTVNFSLTIEGGGAYGVAVWVDWDRSGTFEASERVYNTTTSVSSPHAGSFNIPSTVPLGQYRMRIAIDNSNADISDPCSFNTGEVEDYTLQVGLIYCNPRFSGTSTYYYISGFVTTNGVVDIDNTGTTRGAGGYSDYTTTHSLEGIEGSTINFTITIAGGSTHGSAIWVDWNMDGVFDASERVYNTTALSATPHSGNFTIPGGTPTGSYRMRVAQVYSNANPSDPCTFTTGEVEDYTLIVSEFCTPTFTNTTATHYISGVTTIGSHTNLNNTGTSRGTDGYSNYSSTHSFIALEGSTVNFSLTIEGGGTYGVAVWIDFDGSGTFEATERIYNTTTSVSSPHTGSFNIPITAPLGQYRMRIAIDNSNADISDPCSFNTGEVEDYTIQIGLIYCIPTFTGTSTSYYISGFVTTGGLVDISNTGTTRGAGGYSDYTTTHSLVVVDNATVNFSIIIAGGSTHGSAIWVDWNRDGVFDASERVYNTTSYSATPHTGSFTVPGGTPSAAYRMRVAQDLSNSNPSNPCAFASGEVEDYTLIVGYCTPEFSSTTATYYISGFTTTGGSTNINNTGTGRGTDGYSDYTSTHSVTTYAGATLGFTTTIAGSGTHGSAIWVDWNNNGIFEPTERVYNTTSSIAGPHTGSFSVPLTTLVGTYKMRVAMDHDNGDITDPCYYDTGEVEDYYIIVDYCVPTFSNTSSTYYISGFTTSGSLIDISNTGTGRGTDGYSNYMASHSLYTTDGSTVNFTITAEGGGTHGSAIWIDWNDNGTFEATEKVYGTTSGLASPHTGSFTVPLATPPGNYRMRVALDHANPAITDPCSYNTGEVEDYSFILFDPDMRVPVTGNNSYTTCFGNLYDAGGPNANYSNSSNGYTVLYPLIPGNLISVSGTITSEAGYDYITIYDGDGTGGTVLWGGSRHGTGTSCETFTVPLIVSTTGPLTIRFYADGSTNCAGLDLEINCCDMSSAVITSISATDTTICQGASTTITATTLGDAIEWYTTETGGTVLHTGFSYTVSPSATTTYWAGSVSPYCGQGPRTPITITVLIPDIDFTSSTDTTTLTCSVTSLDITASGGVSYVWSGGSSPTSNINTFTIPGTYYVTVTDSDNCTAIDSITITEDFVPPAITFNHDSGTTTLTCTDTLIYVTAEGGDIYLWSGGDSINSATNSFSRPDTYYVTVTGANGCTSTSFVSITQGTSPPTVSIINNSGYSDLKCPGTSEISVTATGGATYYWSGGLTPNTDTNTFNNQGRYTVTVTAANGCTATASIDITQRPPLEFEILTRNVSCYGLNDGNISVRTLNGGTPPYSYTINDYPATLPANVEAGNYEIRLIDSYNCELIVESTITQPEELTISLATANVQCGVAGGKVYSNVSGGVLTYNYAWSDGQTSRDIINLPAGNYSLTVTDGNGCTVSESASISLVGSISASILEGSEVSCFGYSDGQLLAISDNGLGELTYRWSNAETTSAINNLPAGNYSVTIIDNVGCEGNSSFMLVQPPGMYVQEEIRNVSCNGIPNGSISIEITGGVSPYNSIWSNSQTGTAINNLSPGSYSVVVTDQNSCSLTKNYVINDIDPILINSNVTGVTCHGGADASIIINATGGAEPYNFSLRNGDRTYTGNSHKFLSSGLYSMVVQDRNGCVVVMDTIIRQPEELYASYKITNPTCDKINNGRVEMIVSGGVEPYTYMLNNTAYVDGSLISGIKEGNYKIEVIDGNSCTVKFNNVLISSLNSECLGIPNVFTPNGDGINDEWIIENIELFPDATIYVFNRWGQTIFEGKGSDPAWNGRYNNNLVASGTYMYAIHLNNIDVKYTGVLSVMY